MEKGKSSTQAALFLKRRNYDEKRNRLLVCLAAGVLILAVFATAAFGSVNGYTSIRRR